MYGMTLKRVELFVDGMAPWTKVAWTGVALVHNAKWIKVAEENEIKSLKICMGDHSSSDLSSGAPNNYLFEL